MKNIVNRPVDWLISRKLLELISPIAKNQSTCAIPWGQENNTFSWQFVNYRIDGQINSQIDRQT